jgi:YggT family protein
VASNFLFATAEISDIVLTAYMWIVIIAAIISWVSPNPYNPVVRFLYAVTGPILRPIRRLIGFKIGVDLSPAVVILCILFVKYFLIASLKDIAFKIR